MIIELCFRPCWKLGAGFWERLLLGIHPLQAQDRFEAFERKEASSPVEWIEIRPADAAHSLRNRARIAILAVKATDFIEDK